MRLPPLSGQLDGAADHELRQFLFGRLRRTALPDHPSASNHRDTVRDLEDLLELVADEDDRAAVLRKVSQELENLLRLARCKHCGRLIEHEDLSIAIEHLQDLDPLLLADGQGLDLGIRVQRKSESSGELADAPACLASL